MASCLPRVSCSGFRNYFNRMTQNFGTASVFSMIDMDLWIMPRRRFPPCSTWTKVSDGSCPSAAVCSILITTFFIDFDKANEILFRLGIIYKQQGKYAESLECFDRILRNPPNPLAHADIWFQIGHVFEQQNDVRVTMSLFALY